MKSFLLFLLPAILLVVSCSDDPSTDGRSPVFDKITFAPSSTVAPNDSVTATVEYKTPGNNVYFKYVYKIRGNGIEIESDPILILKPKKEQPVFGFRAPLTAGVYTVTVSTTSVQYTSLGPGGTVYGNPTSASATLTVRE